MKKKVMFILSCLLLSVGFITAQTTRISGIVIDNAGEPVISASVVVKGTTVGTMTDLEGKFTINVPEGRNTLVFTLVGMKTVDVKVSPNMRVVMETDETLLDEVMVVAYGTAKRSQFTGSASVVKADDIKDVQVASVSKALAGKMAGVQVTSTSGRPGADATIRIRGTGSINASNNPLYVVDGVPYQGQLNAINQQDIESITVLKDAAANSLYGARGANGVILVTTKKGTSDGKSKVSVDAKWGVNSRAIPLYDMVSNPADYYELYWQSMRNQQYYSIGSSWSNAGVIASRDLVSTLGGYNIYDVPNGKLIDPVTGKINPNGKILYQDSWEDEIFKNGLRQEYQVGVSGGSNKTSYYLSLSYLDDKGIVDNSGFKRITSRLRLDHNVNNWFKVGANAAYTNSKTKFTNEDGTEGSNMFYIVQSMAPIYPVYEYDANGNRLYEKNGTPIYDFGSGNVNPSHLRPVSSMANPIASQILDQETDRVNTFSGQVFAEIRFLNDFKFITNVRFDNSDNLGLVYQNGQYGQFASFGGISTRYTERSTAITANEMLQWTKAFGNHNFDAMLSHESYQRKYNYTSASKRNFFDASNMELTGAIATPQASSYETNYNVESVLSRVQYDYLSKYFFSASFRTDGSSKFYKDNRWGQFWSVGGSWLLTKENFLKPVNWLDELKFKASFGQQGNDNLNSGGIVPWANQYTVKPNGDNIALERSYIGNRNITWEKSNSFNTGIEFSLLKSKIYGSVEYFNRLTQDLLFSRKMPPSAGYSSYPDNIGDMLNQGVEVELTGSLIRTKDLSWTLSLNATHTVNEMKKLPPENKEIGIDAGLFWYREGKSIYDYYLWDYAGVDSEGKSQWYKDIVDGNGNVTGRELTTDYTEATRYYQGSALPDVYGGISTSVSWKGLDLSIQTMYQLGGTGYDYTYRSLMHAGEEGRAWHKDIFNSWTPENRDTNVPRLEKGNTGSNQAYSNRWLISTDFFSIQNIMLGYTFSKSMLNKLGISSLRVYGVADNVALFSKRKGYDPRESVSGTNGYGRYTPIRTLSFGLNVEF